MRCRLAPVRAAAATLASPVPQQLVVCGYLPCWTLILMCGGATATNRCVEHTGLANEPETEEQRNARIRREIWKR